MINIFLEKYCDIEIILRTKKKFCYLKLKRIFDIAWVPYFEMTYCFFIIWSYTNINIILAFDLTTVLNYFTLELTLLIKYELN